MDIILSENRKSSRDVGLVAKGAGSVLTPSTECACETSRGRGQTGRHDQTLEEHLFTRRFQERSRTTLSHSRMLETRRCFLDVLALSPGNPHERGGTTEMNETVRVGLFRLVQDFSCGRLGYCKVMHRNWDIGRRRLLASQKG